MPHPLTRQALMCNTPQNSSFKLRTTMDQMLYPDSRQLLFLFVSLLTSGQLKLNRCNTKLIMLAKYSSLIGVGNGKSQIQLASLLMNVAGNLSKDSKIRPLFFYANMVNYTARYFAFLFLHFSLCVNFANSVVFKVKVSPHTIALVAPHGTFITCRNNYLLFLSYRGCK